MAGERTKRGFEALRVYQLSERLADAIWTVVKAWDRLAQETVGRQMIRSADSVGANIAEGTGRGSFQDNRRFVRNARGSLYETRHWLRRAHSRHLLSKQNVALIRPIVTELGPRLNAYLRSIGPVIDPESPAATPCEPEDQGPGTKDE